MEFPDCISALLLECLKNIAGHLWKTDWLIDWLDITYEDKHLYTIPSTPPAILKKQQKQVSHETVKV